MEPLIKKKRVTILVTDKVELRTSKITRDKQGHYIMIKGLFAKNI